MVFFDPCVKLYFHVVYSPVLEEMTLSLSSTMSWLCSCILFSIFLDYIFLCTIMWRILWTGDRRKRLLFLNILACYCQFIMSYGILWRDDEDQTLLVRVIWQTSTKLLSLSWQQLVVEKAFESSVWKPKGVKRRHSLPGKTEINHYVDSAGLCDMLICFLSLSLLRPQPPSTISLICQYFAILGWA